MAFKNQLEYRSDILRRAIQGRVIDTRISRMTNPLVSRAMIIASSVKKHHYQDPNTFRLFEHPNSLSWRESVFEPGVHTTISDYWCLELARIVVPRGSVGYLEGIDQVLNDKDGNYFPSNREYWGSPTFSFSEVDDCKWWLTLDHYYNAEPARFELSQTTPFTITRLPGRPYRDLHEIPGLWYPAHSNQKISTIIPGSSILRFFIYSPPQTVYQWQAAGRLRARVQSTFSKYASRNASSTC